MTQIGVGHDLEGKNVLSKKVGSTIFLGPFFGRSILILPVLVPFFGYLLNDPRPPKFSTQGGSRVMRIKVRVAKGNHECPADRTDFNIPCWPTSAVSEG